MKLAGLSLMRTTIPFASPLWNCTPTDESNRTSDEVLRLAGASAGGLTSHEAQRRLKICGRNAIERTRRKSLWLRFL